MNNGIGKNREFDEFIGGNLRKFRHSAGVDAQTLADGMGVSTSMIFGYERGAYTMTLYHIALMAYCFRVQVDEMVYILTDGFTIKFNENEKKQD